jgi:guanine deaminase
MSVSNSHEQDQKWLSLVCKLSKSAVESRAGGPFGAAIVQNDELVATGHNQVIELQDPTAHAEIQAIRNACKALKTKSLEDCVIYSSCQPCPMCLSAIYWARIPRLVFSNDQQQAQSIGFDDAWIQEQLKLPLTVQAIESQHIPCIECEEAFELWRNFPDKISY